MRKARQKPWNIEAINMNPRYMELSAIIVMMVFPVMMKERKQNGKYFAIR